MRIAFLVGLLFAVVGCSERGGASLPGSAHPVDGPAPSTTAAAAAAGASPAPCVRGPLEVAPASWPEQESLLATFEARNGVPHGRTTLDRTGWYLEHVSLPDPLPDPPGKNDAELEALARAFLRKNADLFSVEVGEVDGLEAPEGIRWRTMKLVSDKPQPGHERPGLSRHLSFFISFDEAGHLRTVTNESDWLPRVSLCTIPLLSASDPAIVHAALGATTTVYDNYRHAHTLGPVQEKDLGPPKVTLFVEQSGRARRITLTYAMDYGSGATVYVDANTGRFVAFYSHSKS